MYTYCCAVETSYIRRATGRLYYTYNAVHIVAGPPVDTSVCGESGKKFSEYSSGGKLRILCLYLPGQSSTPLFGKPFVGNR